MTLKGPDFKLRVLTNVKKMRNGSISEESFTKSFEEEMKFVSDKFGNIFDMYEINISSPYSKTLCEGIIVKKTTHIPKLHILMRYTVEKDK